MISRYWVIGNKVLEYGSGTGITAGFLQKINLDVIGADISEAMVNEAKKNYPGIPFYKITNNFLPFGDGNFDFIVSSLVVLCIENKQAITQYFKEAHRVLKKDGLIFVITVDANFYTRNWYNMITDFPENKNLKSGDPAKTCLLNESIDFIDYYWTNQDCIDCMKATGFELIETYYPLGKDSEPFAWEHEKIRSPFVIFVGKAIR